MHCLMTGHSKTALLAVLPTHSTAEVRVVALLTNKIILGFTPDLREALMWDLWNDVANPAGPPKSKYKNFRQVVLWDLQELQLRP